jgi:hypothetical protein
MSRKHHSKNHFSKKHTKEKSNEVLNKSMKNNQADVHNYKNCEYDSSKDHYDICKKDSSAENYSDNSIGYNSSQDLCDKCKENFSDKPTGYDSAQDLYENFEEDNSSEDHYDKPIGYDSDQDLYDKCKDNNSSEDHYDKSIGYDSVQDLYDKCKDDNSSEDFPDKSIGYDSAQDLYENFEEDNSSEDYHDKSISYDYHDEKTDCIKKYSTKQGESKNNGRCDIDKNDTLKCCKTDVTTRILPICPSTLQTPSTICNSVIIKVPVVLSESTVTISIISSIKLDHPASEIKGIEKNVCLTQCKLIPNSGDGDPNSSIMFISGFIRNNIEYVTKDYSNKNTFSENVKHTKVNVPFDCTTRIAFLSRPIFIDYDPQIKVKFPQNPLVYCEEGLKINNGFEQNLKFTQIYNEEVFCELASVEIVEVSVLENPIEKICQRPTNQIFRDITEKIVLNLTIKVFQNQQLKIP